MQMKPMAVIIDLDGTLCDSRHRLHHIVNPEGKVDWAAWDAGAHLDTPNQWCVELTMALYCSRINLIFLTGRGERLQEVTQDWLSKHLPMVAKAWLFMRKDGDHRPDTVVKEEIYRNEIEPNFNVLFAVDDRNSVVEMWRKIGVTCLHCDNWTAEMEAAANHYVKPEHKQS